VEDFIRKESLHDEIEEQLLYKIDSASGPESLARPRTFAEATMSTRPRGARKDSIKDGDPSLNGPMSLESLAPFKYTFKKKKKANKWFPFDLSTADSPSEVGSSSEVDIDSSRAASPNPPSTLLGSASFSSPQRSDLTSTLTIPNSTPSPAKDKGRGRLIEEVETEANDIGYTHQTPTQENFRSTVLAPVPASSSADTASFLGRIEHKCLLDELNLDNNPHNEPAQNRTEAAMASIAGAFVRAKVSKVTISNDFFDSVEWDKDRQSAASTPDSPECVTTASEPLAYTTVGSLVRSNALPQFTAPNRIQRGGAGRRPRRALKTHRCQDSSCFHPRDPPAPLSMPNSTPYTQQLAQSPVRFYQAQQPTSSNSSRSTISLQQMSLTDEEMRIFKRVGGPQMLSGNIAGSPLTRHPSKTQSTSTVQPENKNLTTGSSPANAVTNNQDVNLQTSVPANLSEDRQRRTTPLSGLEKMQTIQRLAKFDNPMQQIARSRLSRLSITNYLGRTVPSPTEPATSSSSPAPEPKSRKQVEFNHSHQVSPPEFGTSTLFQTTQDPPVSQPSGVPQPLTAGPPGQRQYLGAGANKATAAFTDSAQFGGEMSNTAYEDYLRETATDPRYQFYNSTLSQQTFNNQMPQDLNMSTSQPAAAQQTLNAAFQGEIVGYKSADTLPMSSIAKYYPKGFPSDMTGKFNPLSFKMKVKMAQIPGVGEPITDEEKAEFQALERDHYWYSGQRRWGMKADDFIDELEQGLLNQRISQFGAIGPPSEPFVERKPITEEEMENMTTAQAAALAIDALFGTFLAYADETSESRCLLSGFERPAPERLLDKSMKGIMSLFGEDWGTPLTRGGGVS
jgi:hypothetical protein